MTAADIFNYCLPFIEGLGPAIFVIAIICNAGLLIDLFLRIFTSPDSGDYY